VSEPVAIVGMACRFPGGVDDPESFWQLLQEGRDAIRPIERDGIDVDRLYEPNPATPGRMMTRWGGFLDDVEHFDAAFFGISPREAATVDPAQRLLLEATWEALEDAMIDPGSLAGQPVGVFVGQWLSDFESRLFADPDQIDFHSTTGSGRYASSGRLSFVLDAVGPSLTVDTACSSSLVAVHLACQSLRAGESQVAVAAGVNVILQPHISIAYSQSRMMAADGRCKFGDAGGDGYVRSEGVGVVVLKPLVAALADGDPVRAVIRGSAVNNDGRGSGHMATPSRTGQAAMLRSAYADAGVDPGRVGYVEAHGTGTRTGDPVELGALADVVGPGRQPGDRCRVGSVKTNIGHTEGAAGMAGLLKCVLALQQEEIPPSLHLHEPNPTIPWDELPLDVPQKAAPWPRRAGGTRHAGVSAFGITGTNAHLVLEEAPAAAPASPTGDERVQLLVLSAAAPDALRAQAAAIADLLESDRAPSVRDLCATAARHRATLEHRAAFVAGEPGALAGRLRRFAADEADAADATGRSDGVASRVAFVFPGQGGQWIGMARELLADEPVFRLAIERCDAALPAGTGWSVSQQLLSEPGTPLHRLDEISVVQPVLLAVEIGLAELWRSWGIEPAATIGHSLGEIGAAHIGGALSLGDAMQVICTRSALMQRTSGRGAMAVLELSWEEATQRLEPYRGRIGVAVTNGPRSTVVSGDADAVAALLAECKRQEVFGRAVKVDVASHSPHMDPLVPELVAGLAGLAPGPAGTTISSTVDAAPREGTGWDAAYWGRNLPQPVLFAPAMERVLADGVDAVIEVGPHPTLLGSLPAPDGDARRAPLGVASLRRHAPERASLLASLGALWVRGHDVRWNALIPDGTYARVALPHYPWQRQRHWADAALPVPAGGQTRRATLDDVARQSIHSWTWEPAPIEGRGDDRSWLVVGSDGSAVADLRLAFERESSTVTAADSWEDAAQLLAAGLSGTGAAPRQWGIVALAEPETSAFAVVAALQALSDLPAPAGTPRLWWVTRGAHSVAGEQPSADAAAQAAVWGAARVVATEQPDGWGGLVDLDPSLPLPDQAGVLVAHLCAGDGEDQVALRHGERYALRLVPAPPEAAAAAYPWRADGGYLITGGLGGVGLELAAAMVRDGARRLLLMGRTPLPPRAAWADAGHDPETARRIAAVRALEHAGAAVHLLVADVADGAQVRDALDGYAREGWPPIVGIIHAAAVLENRLATDLDQATFDRVLAPKLTGALVLDRLLPELDLFVLCSSFAAFWAPVGMVSYAAANAGLDGLAQARLARGAHALSVQWGPWADTGLYERAVSASSIEDLAREGVGALTVEQATLLLRSLLAQPAPVMAALPIDWAAFCRGGRRHTEALYRSAVGDGALAHHAVDMIDRLLAATPADRRAAIEGLVRETVGGVLRLPAKELDLRRPFGLMGLDSLMALELRNRFERALGRPLSATLAWNHPTVEALTAHFDALLAPEPTSLPDADQPGAAPAPALLEGADADGLLAELAEISELSDADVAHALRGAR